MHDVRARSIAVGLAAGLALATGCGDDTDGALPDSGTSGSGCSIVTRQDASMLFGHDAEDRTAGSVARLTILACIWIYEVEDETGSLSSQSLVFYVWPPSVQYHTVPPDSEALPVGDDGYIKWSEADGIYTGWIQDGHAIMLSYFSVGDDMPTHASRVEPMKVLAQDVSDRW